MNPKLKIIIDEITDDSFLEKKNEFIAKISEKFDEFENIIASKDKSISELSSKVINTLSSFSEHGRSNEHIRYKLNTLIEEFNVVTSQEAKKNISTYNLVDLIDLLGDEIRRKKSAEKIFLKEQAKLVSLIENTKDAILLLDTNFKLTLYNSAFKFFIESVLGKKPVLGEDINIYFPDKLKNKWEEYLNMTLRGEVVTFEMEVPNGLHTDYYDMSFNPIISGSIGRKSVNGISIFARNINERKKVETDLKNSQSHLFHIINSISDPIFVKDRNHKMVFANEAHCKLLGRGMDEIIGKDDYDFHLKEEADIYWKADEDVFNSGIENVNEETNTSKTGETHYVITKKNLYTNENKDEYIVGIVNDITERKTAEEKIKELNKNLEEKVREEIEKNREKEALLLKQSRNAAMGEMIGNIAHQWRQPLNGLALIIQDIEESYLYSELNAEYIKNSVSKSMSIIQHMSQTIDDFRNFFKPDKEKQSFSIKAVLEKTISFVEASFRNNKIELSLYVGNDMFITGFPNEYSQVIINILNNAKDVILERKVECPYVRITLKDNYGKALLLIDDNAGGIDTEVIEKVFDPYFTTKEQGKGTGIGLYMSKTIIEKNMGGKLKVRNTGQGAEFSIEI